MHDQLEQQKRYASMLHYPLFHTEAFVKDCLLFGFLMLVPAASMSLWNLDLDANLKLAIAVGNAVIWLFLSFIFGRLLMRLLKPCAFACGLSAPHAAGDEKSLSQIVMLQLFLFGFMYAWFSCVRSQDMLLVAVHLVLMSLPLIALAIFQVRGTFSRFEERVRLIASGEFVRRPGAMRTPEETKIFLQTAKFMNDSVAMDVLSRELEVS